MSATTAPRLSNFRQNKTLLYLLKNKYLYLLLIPSFVFFVIFHYIPMYGVVIAFQDFRFGRGIMGSPWIGFDNFRHLFELRDFWNVFRNSLVLSLLRLFVNFPIPIILAIMINEIPFLRLKRVTQSAIYLPHFISWVVLGGIIINVLSPSWGFVNNFLQSLGFEPIFFMASDRHFPGIVVLTNVWKSAGWSTIIFLAAITGINPELYEAAMLDGASRMQRILYITLPGMRSTIIILLLLTIGGLMTNGFEQIFILQNASNIAVSEVFETYTYKLGVVNGRFSFATAVGLFNSVIGLILLLFANTAARLIGEDGIF